MSDNNRVVWSEGLFLRPQHFQQQDRYIESFVEGRTSRLRSNPWGFSELVLDNELLTSSGTLAVRRARGVFPDGTPFAVPDNEPAPPTLTLDPLVRDQVVYLALPFRQSGSTLLDRSSSADGVSRYRARVAEARDVSSDAGASAELETAALNLRLMLHSESDQDFMRIPVAHVKECRANKQVILEDAFIPTVLTADAASRLTTYLSEIQGLTHQLAEALATRAVASTGGSAEIVEYLMLQVLNRYEPWITHLATTGSCHPEDLYLLILQMAGELSTFATKSRRPPKFPVYRHDALRQSFEPAMAALRECFAVNPGGSVVRVPLVLKKFNIRIGTVADKSLFDSAVFVLAVRAELSTDELRRNFLAQCTIAPSEMIGERVNNHLGGIGLRTLPVAPRQLHNIAGSHYFEMERGSDLWRGLKTSGGIAIHLAGEFPGLELDCWAIRG